MGHITLNRFNGFFMGMYLFSIVSCIFRRITLEGSVADRFSSADVRYFFRWRYISYATNNE